ncbi:MAG: DNRLRE domain-containing protein, partial [Sphingobacteriales bacterium]
PSPTPYWGNNYFPGTPLPNTNPGSVYLVDRAAATWFENSVNWTNSPGFEPAISAPIPVTTTQWNGSVGVDVTNLVQEIMNGGGVNNGFYLKLDNEVHYRSQVYATSEYPDSKLRPVLVVEYKVFCDPSFSYCMNTNSPYTLNFTANNLSYGNYNWTVDGSYAGNGPNLAYNFPGAGSYEVCLTTVGDDGEKCSKCIKLCLNDNGKVATVKAQAAQPAAGPGKAAKADNPISDLNTHLLIAPNPANDRISVQAPFEMYQLSIKSSFGLTVLNTKYDGQKAVELSVSKLQPGTYVVEVSNKEGQLSREKFTKL